MGQQQKNHSKRRKEKKEVDGKWNSQSNKSGRADKSQEFHRIYNAK